MKRKINVAHLILAIAGILAVVTITGHLAMNAIMQESFKLYPPTQAEIAEDPGLARFAK